MMNRVVITGMGIWSCLGTTLEEVKESSSKNYLMLKHQKILKINFENKNKKTEIEIINILN